MSINLRRGRFASWCRKNGLFCAIVSWILLAIIAYTLLSAIWGDGRGWSRVLTGWRIGANHDPLDRIKVTLTALGGVGAVGYLVIKYRERAALERGEADEKLVRAVQQLGDPSPQVRIAGVYALADVADTYEGPYHQRVVDILCGYLRTDRLLKDAKGDTRYATNDDGTPNYDQPLSADGAVESTILFVLANHLYVSHQDKGTKGHSEGRWSQCHLDLHNAHLTEAVVFHNAFVGNINATGTHFAKDSSFLQCTFMSGTNFRNAKFVDVVDFRFAKFKGATVFSEAEFKSDAYFQGSTFDLTYFKNATFIGVIDFGGHLTGNAAHFKGESDFRGATFGEFANFGASITDRGCSGVIFEEEAYFDDCTFIGPANFQGTTFKHLTSFGNYFLGEGATFKSSATFTDAMFESANFLEVTFEGETDFSQARFRRDANFGGSISSRASTIFMRRARFEAVCFDSRVNFEGHESSNGTAFRMGVSFNDTAFKEEPNFKAVRFNRHLKHSGEVVFPRNLELNEEGLPEGSHWVDFDSVDPIDSTNKRHQERSNENDSSDNNSIERGKRTQKRRRKHK